MSKFAGQSEDFVKIRIRQILPLYFLYTEETTGIGPMGQKVRIDFWCKAKPGLIDLGFPDIPIGIEAKSHDLKDHRKKTAIRLIHQAILYRNSRFPTREGFMQPGMVLVYPQISVLLGLGEHVPSGMCDRWKGGGETLEDGVEYSLIRLAGVDRIGELIILQESHFMILVNGQRYFDSHIGLSNGNPLPMQTLRASR